MTHLRKQVQKHRAHTAWQGALRIDSALIWKRAVVFYVIEFTHTL